MDQVKPLTLKVVNASVLTSKAPPSIQGKNFQNTPSPDRFCSTSMCSMFIAFSFSFDWSYNTIAAIDSYFKISLRTTPHGIALPLCAYPRHSSIITSGLELITYDKAGGSREEPLGGLKRKMYENMDWVSFRDSKGSRWMLWAREYKRSSCMTAVTSCDTCSGLLSVSVTQTYQSLLV